MQLLISLKQLYLNQGNTEIPKLVLVYLGPGTMKCRLVIIHNNNINNNNQLLFNNI